MLLSASARLLMSASGSARLLMSPSERERSVGAAGNIADVAEPLEETADVVDALGIIINVAEVIMIMPAVQSCSLRCSAT